MAVPPAVLLAFTEPVSDDRLEEFHRWYDEVHVPELIGKIDGVVSATRYVLGAQQLVPAAELPGRRFLAVYTLDGPDVASVADRLGRALRDGEFRMSPAVNDSDKAPVLHFYTPIGASRSAAGPTP